MSETPESAEARRIVDDLEKDIVDVEQADHDSAEEGADTGRAEDETDDVPGSPEPPS